MEISDVALIGVKVIDRIAGNLLSAEENIDASELAMSAAQQSREIIIEKGGEFKDRVVEVIDGALDAVTPDTDLLVGKGVDFVSFLRGASATLIEYGKSSTEDKGVVSMLANLPKEILSLKDAQESTWDVRNFPRD